ncbi:hypothetical protein APX70_02558 [Pseudomonas syringae pv. maculicola]|uniref:Uncharacterized protein n=1 Tax=Pseudomonas syringae pv. maculicola TaxID=59511 RepID=A0A3M2X4I1_PSEYM|nr:hypothetical protein APX70_02558 [Pseudomonas syringae pv. maculicola]
MATTILTQVGIKRVALSICPLNASSLVWVSASKLPTLFLSIKRMVSEVRYMSFRTLVTASAGTFDSDP